MGWLKKFKKALGLENKRKIPKQESKPAPKASTRKAAPKYSDRAPNVQKMKAKEAYRAKREVTAHKAVSSMSKGAKQTFKKNTQKSPVQRFNAGLIRGGAMMGLPSTKGMPKTVKNSTAFKAGNVVGTAASYLGGYGAVGKGLAKGSAKTFAKVAAEKQAGKNLGKVATKDFLKSPNTAKFTAKQVKQAEKKVAKTRVADKLADTKVIRKAAERQVKADEAKAAIKTGKKVVQKNAAKAEKTFQDKVSKEATKKAEKVVEKVKQNVVADATVGAALDTAHAKGEGIEIGSKDYAKYMTESAALNVGFGVGSEAFGGVVRGVKALRNGKKLVRLEKDGKIIHRVIGDDERALSGKFSGPEVTEATSRAKAAEKKAEDATEPTVLEAAERGKKMPNGNYLVKEDGKTKIVTAKQYNKAQRNLDAMRARTQKMIDRADERERIAGTAIREGKRVSPDAEVMAQASRRKSVAGQKNLDVPEIAANIDKRPGRIAKDGELTRLGEGKVVKTLQQGKDIGAARGPELTEPIRVQGQKGGLKRADLRTPEQKQAAESLKAATEDKAFVEKVRNGDIDIKKMAEDEGISMREATIKAHENFRKPDIKTAKGAEEEVLGAPAKVLTRRPEVEGGMLGKVKGAYDFFIRNVVDNTHEIARMAKKYGDESVVHLLDRAKSVVSNADNMINGDRQVILLKNGGSIENGESLKRIFKPIMDKGEAYEQDFADFMYHRMNATYRHDAGSDVFGGGMTKEESERIYKELLEKHPEFEEEAEKVYKYLDGLNQIEMDAGRLTRKQYEWMKENNPYYVPSYRQKYIDSGAGVVTHGNSIGGSVNRRAVGSNSDIAPLHEQLAFETYRRMEASAFNDLGLRLTKDLGEDSITSVRKLDGPFKSYEKLPDGRAKVQIYNQKGKLVTKTISEEEAQAMKSRFMNSEILDAESGIFPKQIEEDAGSYYLNVRDGDSIYKVGINKDLFDALDSIHKAPKKWPVAYQANTVFRNLVTNYNPLFAVRNGVRDFLDAPAFSKYPAAFYKNYARAWKHMKSDSELWKTYKDLGGTAESFIDVAKQWQDGNWFHRNILQRIETLNSAVEQAPRFAEFLSTIEKKGNTKEGLLEALNNAHEITLNFGRHGDVGMTLNANGFTFLNAGIQDAARIARVFKNAKSNPAALGRLFVGASMLGIAPSVINELALGDRKEYQDLRTSEKDLNFLIPMDWFPGVDTNEKFLKIPKGRVSSVFAMPIQRAIREQQGNTKVGETMTTGLGEDIREQIAPMNPFTNNLAEPLRQASSKDGKTWYGASIVPSSMADKKPEDQTDENTTRLATFIGKQTGLSPKRLDYLLQQYGGVIYQAGKGLPVVGKPSITGDKISADSAAKTVGTILGSNFVSDSNSNNGYSNMVYDHTAKLKTYKDDSVADNMAYKYMSVGQSKIGELSKQIKEVNADKNLSAEEKQKRVREIRREQIKVSKQYLGNEQKAKKVANSVASSMDKKDFTTKSGEYSENKYNAALKEQMRVKLDGAKALVAEEDAKAKPGEKTLSQKLKKAGISAEKYYEYKAQGATLAQVKKAKERGISPETYVGAQQAKKGSKSFGETLCRWIDNGYVKNFEDFEVFDPGAKKNTWNAVVWAKNHNMSTKKIAKVIGTDTASNQENRQRIKKYGSSASGKFYTSDGLYKYIESEHGNLSRKEKALMYKYYGYGYSWFQNRNPYL